MEPVIGGTADPVTGGISGGHEMENNPLKDKAVGLILEQLQELLVSPPPLLQLSTHIDSEDLVVNQQPVADQQFNSSTIANQQQEGDYLISEPNPSALRAETQPSQNSQAAPVIVATIEGQTQPAEGQSDNSTVQPFELLPIESFIDSISRPIRQPLLEVGTTVPVHLGHKQAQSLMPIYSLAPCQVQVQGIALG
jgi:hypothetical protein